MVNTRLSAEDWIAAALRGLLADGPGAIAVQPLARSLGATKGSFYWHFTSRADLLRAVLERWLVVGTDDEIAAVEATGDEPGAKVRVFARRLVEHIGANPGQLLLPVEGEDDEVRGALEIAAARRVGYLAKLLRAAGHQRGTAQRRATNVYAACLGHAQLAQAAPQALPSSARGRRDLLDELLDVLVA